MFRGLLQTTLLLPVVTGQVKEWAHAGFAFTLISAFVIHWPIDGLIEGVPVEKPLEVFPVGNMFHGHPDAVITLV